MTNLLKNSMYALYAGDTQVIEMFEQISWDTLTNNFNRELYSRIDKESCEIAQRVLSSDLILRYDVAVQQATLACTRQIAELLDLITYPTNGASN